VGPRAGQDIVEKRKILPMPGFEHPAVQPLFSDTIKLVLVILNIWSLISRVLSPQILFWNHVAGILSIFCAQAGARMVYAVEASVLAKIIPKVAKENNLSDVIKVRDAISKAVTNHISTAWLTYTKITLLCVTSLEFATVLNYHYPFFNMEA
jgi:hypothetical protein